MDQLNQISKKVSYSEILVDDYVTISFDQLMICAVFNSTDIVCFLCLVYKREGTEVISK